jgi:hypothetical protein
VFELNVSVNQATSSSKAEEILAEPFFSDKRYLTKKRYITVNRSKIQPIAQNNNGATLVYAKVHRKLSLNA